MKYIGIICSTLLCVGYTISAVRRDQNKVSRGCDIFLAVCWGVSTVCNMLGLLG